MDYSNLASTEWPHHVQAIGFILPLLAIMSLHVPQTQDFLQGILAALLNVNRLLAYIAQRLSALEVTRDTLRRRKSEQNIHRIQALLNTVLDNLPIGLIAKDANSHRFVMWNKASEDLLGHKHVDVIGKTGHDIFAKELVDFLFLEDREALKEGGMVEASGESVYLQLKDGRTLQVRKTPVAIGCDDMKYLLCMVDDITERRKVEEDLRIHISVINAASDQIVVTDKSGRILFVNPAFEKESGYRFDEVCNKDFTHILQSNIENSNLIIKVWEEVLMTDTWHGELSNNRRDGRIVVDDITITSVKDECGEIQNFIAIMRNITYKKDYEAKLDFLAYHDHLTGLPNRLLFCDRLTQRLAQARRNKELIAVLFVDLDRFKYINDTFGHNYGDKLLVAVAERLSGVICEADTLARMGGDEFAVILTNVERIRDVETIALKVLESFWEPFYIGKKEFFVSASIGVSVYPFHGKSVEMLIKNAGTAMYRAKEKHTNAVQIYTDSFRTMALERINMENRLRRALEKEQFKLYYQPRVNLFTGAIAGAEALVRMLDPELGPVSPEQFIPIAEETGLIIQIGNWVLREACRQNKQWLNMGLTKIGIDINISARQLQYENLVQPIKQTLAESGLNAFYLGLEITESMLMHNPEIAAGLLRQLKCMGIKISIDDFGTGHSSLSYLKRFPIDCIKIDRSFVRDITSSSGDAVIAEAIIRMAHNLKMKVVAEGVESLDQMKCLQKLGCDEMQGYLISPPLPPDEFEAYLRNYHDPRCGDMTFRTSF